MKSGTLKCITAMTLFAALAMPTRPEAQEQSAEEQSTTQRETPEPVRYKVTDLGPAGSPFSDPTFVSNKGSVAGFAIASDGASHAVLWHRSLIRDISKPGLGGPNSAAYGANARGQASGLAETSDLDPSGEDFCGYGTHLICLPFLWQNGVMTPLPTLGGNNGEAGEINNRGEVAGNAENMTIDSTCPAGGPQVLQEKPVVWRDGHIKELHTFPGDPDGWAFGINDRGQLAGASGICSTLNPDTGVYILSRHALLWYNGKTIDLGNLGGTGAFGPGNIGHELNNWGQVVGTSDLKGDTEFHAFLWTRNAGMQDLGTLQGDVNSVGIGINDRGQVVGVSFDASFNMRAFLWQNGVMTDLNTLIPADSPLYPLLFAHGINSRGQIVGFGVTSGGGVHAFLATPCDRNHADSECCKEDGEGEAADGTGRPKSRRPVL